MNRIFKYTLDNTSQPQLLWIPPGEEFLSCQFQDSTLTLWFSVDCDRSPVNRIFQVVFTGDSVPDPAIHLATLQHLGLVYHVFQLKG